MIEKATESDKLKTKKEVQIRRVNKYNKKIKTLHESR